MTAVRECELRQLNGYGDVMVVGVSKHTPVGKIAKKKQSEGVRFC